MVSKGKGRIFKRADGKYLVYLPKDLCEDSAFPFTSLMKPSRRGVGSCVNVTVTFSKDPKPTLTLTA